MSFGIRELLMLIGALIFIGVLIDGVRRFQNNRKSQIKLAVDKNVQGEDDDPSEDWYSSELPSGGARVLEQAQNNKAENKIPPRFSEPEDVLMAGLDKNIGVVSEEVHFNYEIDSDKQQDEKQEQEDQGAVIEKNETFQATSNKEELKNESKNRKEQRDLFSNPEPEEESPVKIEKEHNNLPEEVLSINVIAKGDREINGSELLEAVLTFGLRFGDMDIFHRHEHSNGQGNVIFSMASAINPGTFDIKALPDSSLKGVTFFMRLSQVNKRMFVLELMLDIAKRLSNQLDAELKDDAHSVLSSQTVAHYKSRIQEYERKHLGQVLRN